MKEKDYIEKYIVNRYILPFLWILLLLYLEDFSIDWLFFFYLLTGIILFFIVVCIIGASIGIAQDFRSDSKQPPAYAQKFLERRTPREWRETVVSEYWDLYEHQYNKAETKWAVLTVKLRYYGRVVDTVLRFVPVHIINWTSTWVNDWLFPPQSFGATDQVLTPKNGFQQPFYTRSVSKRAAASAAVKKCCFKYFGLTVSFGLGSAGLYYVASYIPQISLLKFVAFFFIAPAFMMFISSILCALVLIIQLSFLLFIGMLWMADRMAFLFCLKPFISKWLSHSLGHRGLADKAAPEVDAGAGQSRYTDAGNP